MLCTGARILLESLKREGVDLFFGYPGGMSRVLSMPPTGMPALPARWAFVSLPPAPVLPIL